MQSTSIQATPTSNIKIAKGIVIRRIAMAVIWSASLQLITLATFILFINVPHMLSLELWPAALTVLIRIRTWIYILTVLFLVLLRGMLYSKGLVQHEDKPVNRFNLLMDYLSVNNLSLVLLFITNGIVYFGIMLSLMDNSVPFFQYIWVNTDRLSDSNYFMAMVGAGIAVYFCAFKVEKNHFDLPVVQTPAYTQLRARFSSLIFSAITTAGMFSAIVFIYSVDLAFFTLLFASFLLVNLHAQEAIFSIILTFKLAFSLQTDLLIYDALSMRKIPLIQHLACLDVFNIARYDAFRRDILFSISQPGGHPYNWNALVSTTLTLLDELTQKILMCVKNEEKLDQSIGTILETYPERMSLNALKENGIKTTVSISPYICRGPLIRNMKLDSEAPVVIIERPTLMDVLKNATIPFILAQIENGFRILHKCAVSPKFWIATFAYTFLPSTYVFVLMIIFVSVFYLTLGTYFHLDAYTPDVYGKLSKIASMYQFHSLSNMFHINYLFGDVPDASIKKILLTEANIIISLSQSLSIFILKSLVEDNYGVVQKDVKQILMALLKLKCALDHVQKSFPALAFGRLRRPLNKDAVYIAILAAVKSAVERSIFSICDGYGEYFEHLNLGNDVQVQLRAFLPQETFMNIKMKRSHF